MVFHHYKGRAIKTCLRAYADSEGTDQPVRLCSLIRAFNIRYQNHCSYLNPVSNGAVL